MSVTCRLTWPVALIPDVFLSTKETAIVGQLQGGEAMFPSYSYIIYLITIIITQYIYGKEHYLAVRQPSLLYHNNMDHATV